MASFIDPRTNSHAGVARPVARTTDDPIALAELKRLCRDGRLYDVERWIQSGRPLQLDQTTAVKQRQRTSALQIALETRNHALVLLLLAN
jgi:hypothetical protein